MPLRNIIVHENLLEDPGTTASYLGAEIRGVFEWVEVPLATIAVLMIIVSGLRAVTSWGSDDGLRQLRRTVFAVVIGFTIIAFKYAFSAAILIDPGTPESGTPTPIMDAIVRMVNGALSYMALIAVVMVIVAGIMMILNIGNDEQYSRARNLIIRVAIGLLVIIASWAVVNMVFTGATV
jgi:type IV secretory pathway VirB2 component (pilin)